MEAVDCPKCTFGKMVPLGALKPATTGNYPVIQYAEWRCVKCGYSVEFGRDNPH